MSVPGPVQYWFEDARFPLPLHAAERPPAANHRVRYALRQEPRHRRQRGVLVRVEDRARRGGPGSRRRAGAGAARARLT